VVKLLLDHGADIGAKATDNWTALHYAAQNGHVEVTRLLFDQEAEIGVRTTAQSTNVAMCQREEALLAAIENEHEAVVKLLVDYGVPISTKRKEYGIALQRVVYDNKEDLVKLLVEKEIGLNGWEYGDALQLACIRGYIAIVDHLLRAGVNPNMVDTHGWSAILCASQSHQKTTLERLFAAGGDASVAAQNTALSPTSWCITDKSTCLLLDDNAMIVRYAGMFPYTLWYAITLINYFVCQDTEPRGTTTAAAVRANHPIPLQNTSFYYEITILNSGETG
jgi:ankyrin repeat protein